MSEIQESLENATQTIAEKLELFAKTGDVKGLSNCLVKKPNVLFVIDSRKNFYGAIIPMEEDAIPLEALGVGIVVDTYRGQVIGSWLDEHAYTWLSVHATTFIDENYCESVYKEHFKNDEVD